MRAGIVGVGFMGWIHYLAYQRSELAEMVAFCEVDAQKRSGDWRSIKGNFGPPGEQIDISNLNVYETLDDMLADDGIDMIDVCLPPALHPEAIRKGLALAEDQWPSLRVPSTGGRSPDPRSTILRTRCARVARDLGIAAATLAPRAALEAIATKRPKSLDGIMTAGSLMKWQAELVQPEVEVYLAENPAKRPKRSTDH